MPKVLRVIQRIARQKPQLFKIRAREIDHRTTYRRG